MVTIAYCLLGYRLRCLQALPEGEDKVALVDQSNRLKKIYDELAAQYHGEKAENEGRLAHA